MDNIINRKPLLEDAFVVSESKLLKALDEKIDQPRFLVIHLTNKVANARKEIKSYLTLEETKVLSLDLSKVSSESFDKEIQSFISDKASTRDEESRMEDLQKKVVLLSGLNTVTQNMISDTQLSQWNLVSDVNSRFVFLVASESTARDIHSKLKTAKMVVNVLDLRDFSERVKSHLGQYKKDVLKIDKDGVFDEKNYSHILPENFESENVLPYRNYKQDAVPHEIKLHEYYYHLNSSQIMCINFFYPLINEKRLHHILEIIGIDDEIKDCKFEKVSAVEKGGYGKKTNFDFYIETKNGKYFYFEIKYTEYEFGKVDYRKEKYHNKFNGVYEHLLNQADVIKPHYRDRKTFLDNYQIMRNLVHIDENSYVVFIYPEENIGIRSGAKLARDQIISSKWQNHFKPITWEAMTEEVLHYVEDDKELKDYYLNQFSRKYML